VIGYISDNLLIPILDFFYGLVPSYGLAIVALTLVIRVALYPLSAGSIRSARRMRIAQPVMQKRQADIKARYASNPQKQQEELGKVMKEFGSPLAGCLPLLVQMPILFALFATLRGSPFADVPYTLNMKVLPADQIAAVEPKPFNSASHSIFISETDHVPVIASLPRGTKIGVGDSASVNVHTKDGQSLFRRSH
jgi:YidC/Oxa1 family membrane protein insertase